MSVKCFFFFWNLNKKWTQKPQIFYFSALVFWCSLFLKNMSTPRLEHTVLLAPFCFKISLKDTSFYISLNSLGFYLSPEYLLNFLWLIYSPICGKKFSIYGVCIPRKCIESMQFYSCSSLPLKTPGRTFWKCVSPRTKRVD